MDTTAGPNAVEVGSWEPMQGLVLKDDLFPHITGGLRGRVLTVASMDVSNKKPTGPLAWVRCNQSILRKWFSNPSML